MPSNSQPFSFLPDKHPPDFARRRILGSVVLHGLLLVVMGSTLGGNLATGGQPADFERHFAVIHCSTQQAGPQTPQHDGAKEEAFEPLVLDEPPAALAAVRRRTEADWDRVEAMARYSAGRVLERQGKLAEAVRQYQRAWRYDPKATAAAEAAVRLALTLQRREEAARIVLKTTAPDAFTATQLMEVGVHLSRQGRWEEAAGVFERLLARRTDVEPTLGDVALQLELGRLEFVLQRPDKAAERFAFVANALSNPEQYGLDRSKQDRLIKDPAAAWRLFGRCFVEAGRLQEARDAFRKAHELDPNRGLLGYELATAALKANQPEEALDELQHYFQSHTAKEGLAPYVLLGEILEKLDRRGELLTRLETLHREDPENAPLGYYLAQQYVLAKRFESAEPLYRRLLETQPAAEGYRGLAGLLYRDRRSADMLELLGRLIENGISLEILDADSETLLRDPQWVSELIAEARKQYQADPKGFSTNVAAAAVLLAVEAEQFDVAEQFFAEVQQNKHRLVRQLWLELSLSLLGKKHYSRAAELLQKGIEQEIVPADNPLGCFYLAGALEMAGRTDEALEVARKAAKLGDEAPRYLLRIAWVLYHAGRNDQARETYRRIVEKHGGDFASEEVRQAVREAKLALSNMAVEEDRAEAERWLEEVLDEFPDDVSALNDLGYLWADANTRLERACRMIRRAVQADPDNAAYRDSLGWVLYRLGQLEEAVAELEKAAAAEPDPVIFDHLGDVQHALGRGEQAKQSWMKAVEAFEKDGKRQQADQIRQKLQPSESSD